MRRSRRSCCRTQIGPAATRRCHLVLGSKTTRNRPSHPTRIGGADYREWRSAQIPIAPAAPTVPISPRFRALALLRRRRSVLVADAVSAASEKPAQYRHKATTDYPPWCGFAVTVTPYGLPGNCCCAACSLAISRWMAPSRVVSASHTHVCSGPICPTPLLRFVDEVDGTGSRPGIAVTGLPSRFNATGMATAICAVNGIGVSLRQAELLVRSNKAVWRLKLGGCGV